MIYIDSSSQQSYHAVREENVLYLRYCRPSVYCLELIGKDIILDIGPRATTGFSAKTRLIIGMLHAQCN